MTRGGKRKNSGRPFSKNRKIMYSTRLKIHQIEWLQKKRNATKTLEILIDKAIKKENDNRYEYLKEINKEGFYDG